MQYNSKDVMPPLFLRCRSVVSPFQVRFKSVPKNGRKMGLTWEAQGSYLGAYLLLMNNYTFSF